MEKIHIIKAIGGIWDTTTTAGKITLLIGLFMIASVGYWIGTERSSYKRDILEAKYKRQLTESKTMDFYYISEFSTSDWLNVEGQGSQLQVPFSEHKVDNPIVTVQQKEENGNWQDIECEIEVDEFNNVIISVIYGFDGRIVLK